MPYDTLPDQLLQAQIGLELRYLADHQIGHLGGRTASLELHLRSTLHAPALLHLKKQQAMPRMQSDNVWEAG